MCVGGYVYVWEGMSMCVGMFERCYYIVRYVEMQLFESGILLLSERQRRGVKWSCPEIVCVILTEERQL